MEGNLHTMDNLAPTVGTEFTADVATKSVILANGGNTLALAIAMLENDELLANYPFGDSKTGDRANFGIYKMNWYMIRQCASAMALIATNPEPATMTSVGTAINGDAGLATRILLEAMETWSTDVPDPFRPVDGNFWAGQRWGQTGLENLQDAKWEDILQYYQAVQGIKAKCDQDPTVWTTDVRYWVEVPAV